MWDRWSGPELPNCTTRYQYRLKFRSNTQDARFELPYGQWFVNWSNINVEYITGGMMIYSNFYNTLSLEKSWGWQIAESLANIGSTKLSGKTGEQLCSQKILASLSGRFRRALRLNNWIVSIPCSWMEAFQPLCPRLNERSWFTLFLRSLLNSEASLVFSWASHSCHSGTRSSSCVFLRLLSEDFVFTYLRNNMIT